MGIRTSLSITLMALSVIAFQTNHPPTVKIESPANHAVLDINTPVTYQLQVTDQEDGDSRYDEINPKEVLLEVALQKPGAKVPRAAPGSAALPTDPRAVSQPAATPLTAPGAAAPPAAAIDTALTIMAANNCYNCHQFNAQSLGPSFYEIAKRYPLTAANTDTLVRRIKDGSSGIWGRVEKMPSHPELTVAVIRSTVHWILQSAARPDRAWYFGTTGLLRFPANRPGTYTLTAAYTDHGIKDQHAPRLTGTDRITIIAR